MRSLGGLIRNMKERIFRSLYSKAARGDKLIVKSFDFNLTEHCNLRCSGCDHASSLFPEKFASVQEFALDIQCLASVLHAKELRLLGGEPLLHPHLLDFLRIAKESRISNRVTLITNGVLLHKMPQELWGLIDRLWISIYPGVKYRMDFERIKKLAAAHDVELWLRNTHHFRLTLLNQEIRDKDLVRRIYRRCDLVHTFNCHTLYEGRYYKCSPAPFIPGRLALLGRAAADWSKDSVTVRGNPRLAQDLKSYLASSEPLGACSYCLGNVGKSFPHRQLNQAGLQAELAADHSNLHELIDWDILASPLGAVRWDVATGLPPWYD